VQLITEFKFVKGYLTLQLHKNIMGSEGAQQLALTLQKCKFLESDFYSGTNHCYQYNQQFNMAKIKSSLAVTGYRDREQQFHLQYFQPKWFTFQAYTNIATTDFTVWSVNIYCSCSTCLLQFSDSFELLLSLNTF
jgi:hypothetical protein